jgi:hypothetical protein
MPSEGGAGGLTQNRIVEQQQPPTQSPNIPRSTTITVDPNHITNEQADQQTEPVQSHDIPTTTNISVDPNHITNEQADQQTEPVQSHDIPTTTNISVDPNHITNEQADQQTSPKNTRSLLDYMLGSKANAESAISGSGIWYNPSTGETSNVWKSGYQYYSYANSGDNGNFWLNSTYGGITNQTVVDRLNMGMGLTNKTPTYGYGNFSNSRPAGYNPNYIRNNGSSFNNSPLENTSPLDDAANNVFSDSQEQHFITNSFNESRISPIADDVGIIGGYTNYEGKVVPLALIVPGSGALYDPGIGTKGEINPNRYIYATTPNGYITGQGLYDTQTGKFIYAYRPGLPDYNWDLYFKPGMNPYEGYTPSNTPPTKAEEVNIGWEYGSNEQMQEEAITGNLAAIDQQSNSIAQTTGYRMLSNPIFAYYHEGRSVESYRIAGIDSNGDIIGTRASDADLSSGGNSSIWDMIFGPTANAQSATNDITGFSTSGPGISPLMPNGVLSDVSTSETPEGFEISQTFVKTLSSGYSTEVTNPLYNKIGGKITGIGLVDSLLTTLWNADVDLKNTIAPPINYDAVFAGAEEVNSKPAWSTERLNTLLHPSQEVKSASLSYIGVGFGDTQGLKTGGDLFAKTIFRSPTAVKTSYIATNYANKAITKISDTSIGRIVVGATESKYATMSTGELLKNVNVDPTAYWGKLIGADLSKSTIAPVDHYVAPNLNAYSPSGLKATFYKSTQKTGNLVVEESPVYSATAPGLPNYGLQGPFADAGIPKKVTYNWMTDSQYLGYLRSGGSGTSTQRMGLDEFNKIFRHISTPDYSGSMAVREFFNEGPLKGGRRLAPYSLYSTPNIEINPLENIVTSRFLKTRGVNNVLSTDAISPMYPVSPSNVGVEVFPRSQIEDVEKVAKSPMVSNVNEVSESMSKNLVELTKATSYKKTSIAPLLFGLKGVTAGNIIPSVSDMIKSSSMVLVSPFASAIPKSGGISSNAVRTSLFADNLAINMSTSTTTTKSSTKSITNSIPTVISNPITYTKTPPYEPRRIPILNFGGGGGGGGLGRKRRSASNRWINFNFITGEPTRVGKKSGHNQYAMPTMSVFDKKTKAKSNGKRRKK